MKVAHLMTTEVVACSPEDTLNRAAQILWDADCGCVPVLDGGRLIGILTDRDICMASYIQGRPLAQLAVAGTMTRNPARCRPGDGLETAVTTMGEHGVRRLPVVDDEERLVGLLSVADVVQGTAREKAKARLKLADHLLETLARITRPRARPAPELEHVAVLEPVAKKAKGGKKKGAKQRA